MLAKIRSPPLQLDRPTPTPTPSREGTRQRNKCRRRPGRPERPVPAVGPAAADPAVGPAAADTTGTPSIRCSSGNEIS